MSDVKIHEYDETHLRVQAEPSIMYELSDKFTFMVPGAKFSPKFQNKVWDGKIRLFNVVSGRVYKGLFSYIVDHCRKRGYSVSAEQSFAATEFSVAEALDFIKTLNLPMEVRDYQVDAFVRAVRDRRRLLLSPTASGKSLIIYLLIRYYEGKDILLIVPTTALVRQMYSDFVSYGYDAATNCNMIYAYDGVDKNSNMPVTISTWQSVYLMPKKWFSNFDVIFGDEAHNFKAKSLISIMEKMNNVVYRVGFTGTLDDSATNKMVLEGLFGDVYEVTTTKALIDAGHLSDFRIKNIILSYGSESRELVYKMDYKDEKDFLVSHERRNRFLMNLAKSQKGNTLLLYQFVEKHGEKLYKELKESMPEDANIFFVSGDVSAEEREDIRQKIMGINQSITVASYGTFSTGTNIPNLDNIIFCSPSKSRVRNLQSIGRGLRKAEGKEMATLYDISDDLTYTSSNGVEYRNTTLEHFVHRLNIYIEQEFEYTNYTVNIE